MSKKGLSRSNLNRLILQEKESVLNKRNRASTSNSHFYEEHNIVLQPENIEVEDHVAPDLNENIQQEIGSLIMTISCLTNHYKQNLKDGTKDITLPERV